LAEKKAKEPKSVLALDLGTAVRKLLKFIGGKAGKWTGGKVVTVDIDGTAIRLLEIKGGMVRKWATASFESDNGEGEAGTDEKTLGTMVKQLMASNGIKARNVVAGISGLYSVSRVLPESNLPPAPTTQEAVLEMAKEIMPLPGDKIYLSWQTMASNGREPLVLTVGVPRHVMDNEVRALKAVGINPQIVELKAMALTRAVNREQALILNIEPSSYDIVIVVNGVPEIMRTIAWKQNGFTTEKAVDAVEHVAANLETTVEFHNSHHLETPVETTTPIFITGQMSTDITLVEKLQARLDYPVEPLAPPLGFPAYLPVSQYAVNIGLALRKTASSENSGQGRPLPLEINLLPDTYRPWRPTGKQLYSLAIIVMALALLFPLFQITNEATARTASLQSKFNVINVKLEQMKLEIQRREPLQKAIGEYQTIVDMGGYFTGDLVTIRSEAEKLGVNVGSILHQGNNIDVSCQADNYIIFRQYLTALEESGRFATPIPPPEGYPYTSGGIIKVQPKAGE
jgi:hypothetical protein